jgi:hypothetical protein
MHATSLLAVYTPTNATLSRTAPYNHLRQGIMRSASAALLLAHHTWRLLLTLAVVAAIRSVVTCSLAKSHPCAVES